MGKPIPMSRDFRIQVRTSFWGIHHWPAAPEEVAFLRNPHRHHFKVEIECNADHDDRELEFFMVKSRIDRFISGTLQPYHPSMHLLLNMGSMSCEMLAQSIGVYLEAQYSRPFTVIVREDDESAGLFV
jgi:hypothetical protein